MGLAAGLAGLVLAFGSAAHAGAIDPAAVDCSSAKFDDLKSAFIAQRGPIPAAAATMILPAGGGARLLFKQPMGADTDARSFRAFEISELATSRMTGEELPIQSIDPAEASADGQFKPSDSASVVVNIPVGTPWQIRSFAVVACKGKSFSGWGALSAPVSRPWVTVAICTATGLLIYSLAMLAVFNQRKKQKSDGLATKYPAVFAARAMDIGDFFNPIHLITNAFNQGSVQKAQVVLFSFLVGDLVLSLVLRTGALVDLSATVVALLGISGIGAAAAQIAYQQKTRLSFDNWAWLQKRKVLLAPSPADSDGPYWRDLVLTNREFDVYKLQTIIFTVAVASALIVSGASHLSSFSVPDGLLGILGLSQVVYVGGVMVKPPAVANLDDAITRLRAAGETLAAAIAQGTDTDANAKLLPPPVPQPAINARRQYDDLADQVEAMIESALEVPADRAALNP